MRTFGIIALTVLTLTGCKKQIINDVDASIVQGEWKITFFQEDLNNETSDFTDYRFVFNENGTVAVHPGALTVVYSGTWDMKRDDNHVDFMLDFGTQELLEELNDDWEIESNSETKLELKDISGGDGSTDWLTFEKI